MHIKTNYTTHIKMHSVCPNVSKPHIIHRRALALHCLELCLASHRVLIRFLTYDILSQRTGVMPNVRKPA